MRRRPVSPAQYSRTRLRAAIADSGSARARRFSRSEQPQTITRVSARGITAPKQGSSPAPQAPLVSPRCHAARSQVTPEGGAEKTAVNASSG